jgi:hypothetical protein
MLHVKHFGTIAMMFSAIPPAWARPRKRGVYQVFTLSWDFSFHYPNGAPPVWINLYLSQFSVPIVPIAPKHPEHEAE